MGFRRSRSITIGDSNGRRLQDPHGLFIPRDGKPYLILHDENDTWSYVVNTPGVMCRIRTLTKPGSNKSLFSGYREWGELVEALPDSAFPLIPLNASSMSTIAKALADSK